MTGSESRTNRHKDKTMMHISCLIITLGTLASLPLAANTLATATCSYPNNTIMKSDSIEASCSLENVVYGQSDATSRAGQGSLYVSLGVNSAYYAPYASATASFDMSFVSPVTITWLLSGYGETDVGRYLNATLDLGPVFLSGAQVDAILMQRSPNVPGVFVETVPAGDWKFSEFAVISDQGYVQLAASIKNINTTPEPSTVMLFVLGALAVGLSRNARRISP